MAVESRVVEFAGVDGVSLWLIDDLVMVAVDVVVIEAPDGSIMVFDDRPTGDMLLLSVTLVGLALIPPMAPAPPITVVVVALPVELFSSTMVLDVSDEIDIFVASDDIDLVIVLSLVLSFFIALVLWNASYPDDLTSTLLLRFSKLLTSLDFLWLADTNELLNDFGISDFSPSSLL